MAPTSKTNAINKKLVTNTTVTS
uniref:Uncharacterized protein n=1 Tax=Rhizophora mucronata TaxID=61149 RepID=A0A2P2R2D2_RHIMU